MNLAIFGLGYVGCVSVACFAREGHNVIGVDINQDKVNIINEGKSPIIESGLAELIHEGVQKRLITASTDSKMAVEKSDLIMVCVGTPSNPNGSLDLQYVQRVCQEIGQALKGKESYSVITIRSTMLPGSAEDILIPILEKSSGKQIGKEFGFCINPEFLREGSAIKDFDNPSFTIIGAYDNRSASVLKPLYLNIDAPIFQVGLGEAEMVKYSSNAFHALKVTFANEIGNICQSYGVDSHQVMDIFVKDNKLNLSPYYLKPGFSFGGSCLPKDLRAILYAANTHDVKVPVLSSILPSNDLQTQKVIDLILSLDLKKIGVLGLSFKRTTDDLRESPALELTEQLIGKGMEVMVYDHEVSLSKLHGSNQVYLERKLPHINSILKDNLEDIVYSSEVIVVTKDLGTLEQKRLFDVLDKKHILIDLIRLKKEQLDSFFGAYYGISW